MQKFWSPNQCVHIRDVVQQQVFSQAGAGFFCKQGNPDLAARYARLALAVLEEQDQVSAAAVAHLLLAYIENERGDGAAALEALGRAEPAIAAGVSDFHRALFMIERARALLLTNEREAAAGLAMAALPQIADTSTLDNGRAQALLGDVFKALGERERAQEVYELALETLPSVDRNLLRVYAGLAEILEETGRKEEALDLLKQAMQLQQRQYAGNQCRREESLPELSFFTETVRQEIRQKERQREFGDLRGLD